MPQPRFSNFIRHQIVPTHVEKNESEVMPAINRRTFSAGLAAGVTTAVLGAPGRAQTPVAIRNVVLVHACTLMDPAGATSLRAFNLPASMLPQFRIH